MRLPFGMATCSASFQFCLTNRLNVSDHVASYMSRKCGSGARRRAWVRSRPVQTASMWQSRKSRDGIFSSSPGASEVSRITSLAPDVPAPSAKRLQVVVLWPRRATCETTHPAAPACCLPQNDISKLQELARCIMYGCLGTRAPMAY